jgi:hypothetical protein
MSWMSRPIWRKGLLCDMVTRVAHICRRIEGEWKLAHRHIGFPRGQ